MKSKIYYGKIRHRRYRERSHEFSYSLFMLYLDLDEVPVLFQSTRWWSYEKWNLASFFKKDFMSPQAADIKSGVRQFIEEKTGQQHSGPVRMLAHLRYAGICFNPITLYYCFNAADTELEHLVAEVHNTPWNERHLYLLEPRPAGDKHIFSFPKQFHVSPFMPLDMIYRCVFTTPGENLLFHLENLEQQKLQFDATLNMQGKPATPAELDKAIIKFPLMTLSVLKGIYWHALRLWLKKVSFYSHPKSTSPAQEPNV